MAEYSEATNLTHLVNLLRQIESAKTTSEIGTFVSSFLSKFGEYLRHVKRFNMAEWLNEDAPASAQASQREELDLNKIATAFVFKARKMADS